MNRVALLAAAVVAVDPRVFVTTTTTAGPQILTTLTFTQQTIPTIPTTWITVAPATPPMTTQATEATSASAAVICPTCPGQVPCSRMCQWSAPLPAGVKKAYVIHYDDRVVRVMVYDDGRVVPWSRLRGRQFKLPVDA